MSPAPDTGLGKLKTEADLQRVIERLLLEKFGLVKFNRIEGQLQDGQLPQPMRFVELSADPDAPPTNEVLIYAIDSGAGKTQVRARFATGAIQTISTEP